jgi:hypothetical protein
MSAPIEEACLRLFTETVTVKNGVCALEGAREARAYAIQVHRTLDGQAMNMGSSVSLDTFIDGPTCKPGQLLLNVPDGEYTVQYALF